MILFFSGTGNSEYVAKRIAKAIGEPSVNLFGKIRNNDYSTLSSDTPWIIVTPTYAWRIPTILQDWIEHTTLNGNKKIYFVMTCGGSNGNADKYLAKLCHFKQMEYQGCLPIIMPENYIALFSVPEKAEALQIIEKAETKINPAVRYLNEHKPFPKPEITLQDKLNSGIINDLYYPLLVHAKKFYATEQCISCGKCADVCPLKNIRQENGRPTWGKQCTHCMACICQCPKEAIEYGKHTKGKIRYTCPK